LENHKITHPHTSIEPERLSWLLHQQHGKHGLLRLAQPKRAQVVGHVALRHLAELRAEGAHFRDHGVHERVGRGVLDLDGGLSGDLLVGVALDVVLADLRIKAGRAGKKRRKERERVSQHHWRLVHWLGTSGVYGMSQRETKASS
jgi:hypothetical protein